VSFTPPADEKPEITDDVESSRAPLLEHLNELRARLIKSILALSVIYAGYQEMWLVEG
jgi:sec-independent protein translocase protein TatC